MAYLSTNKVVWKYPIGTVIEVPIGASIIHFGTQHNHPMIWAECDPMGPKAPRRFEQILTGMEIPKDGVHIGSVVNPSGFVYHIYEIMA